MENKQERLDAEGIRLEAGAAVRGKVDLVGYDDRLAEDRFVVFHSAPTAEQAEVLREFGRMLAGTSRDGGRKRAAGLKPSWKVDTSHEAAIWSHMRKWRMGERVDPESGQHPLVHLAWRALAIAWQETHLTAAEMPEDTVITLEEGR